MKQQINSKQDDSANFQDKFYLKMADTIGTQQYWDSLFEQDYNEDWRGSQPANDG